MIALSGSPESVQRPSLMIADDDAIVIATLAGRLSEWFELVGFAVDADEAIALAEAQQPDAAIVDLEMPAGGGLRATREIHAVAPRTAVVILSVDEQQDSVLELLSAGAICYARKGVSADDLAGQVTDAIAAHASGRCGS